MMQDRAPACGLSWVTLAAVGRVDPQLARPEEAVPAAMATAQRLCSGGRDTSTDAGWQSAVRSVGDGTAHLHRVLAAATVYSTVMQSGVPLNAAARAAIDSAIDQIGLPYVWGGNGPHQDDVGFDCSGLTKTAYATAGIDLPRTAHTQFFATRRLASGDTVAVALDRRAPRSIFDDLPRLPWLLPVRATASPVLQTRACCLATSSRCVP
jgi:cell wall-associated NlpC family hydrolase